MKIEIELTKKERTAMLLFIGIFAVFGLSYATGYPDIGDPDSYFNRIHADCSNCTNLPAAQVTGNFTQTVNFTNNITFTDPDVFFRGIASGSGNALCIDATTKQPYRNAGLTDCTASTEKVKINIRKADTITSAFDNKFRKVEAVRYESQNENTGTTHWGLSAQQVALIFPEVVGTDYEGQGTIIGAEKDFFGNVIGMRYSDGTIATITGIRYPEFTAMLIGIVQKQQSQIDNIQSELNTLKNAKIPQALPTTTTTVINGTEVTVTPQPKSFMDWLLGR